jgi:hypothetical protein
MHPIGDDRVGGGRRLEGEQQQRTRSEEKLRH